MLRPCHAIRAALAVALVLAARPMSASADSTRVADYSLSIPGGLPAADPTAQSPQLEATLPVGSIVPQVDSTGKQINPLTINSSSGFDTSGLLVLLRTNPADATQQQFGLSFFGTGLSASGHLDFGLSMTSNLSQPPTLDFTLPSGGSLSLSGTWADSTQTPPTTVTGSTTPPTTSTDEVPEPLSLILWSSLSALGLWYGHASRRRARIPALSSHSTA